MKKVQVLLGGSDVSQLGEVLLVRFSFNHWSRVLLL